MRCTPIFNRPKKNDFTRLQHLKPIQRRFQSAIYTALRRSDTPVVSLLKLTAASKDAFILNCDRWRSQGRYSIIGMKPIWFGMSREESYINRSARFDDDAEEQNKPLDAAALSKKATHFTTAPAFAGLFGYHDMTWSDLWSTSNEPDCWGFRAVLRPRYCSGR